MMNRTQTLEAAAPLLMRLIRFVVIAASLVFIAIQIARVVWLILSGVDALAPQPQMSSRSVAQTGVNIDTAILNRITPFKRGLTSAEPDDRDTGADAPETDLNLILNGIRADKDGQGVAFISSKKGKQRRYAVGDEVEGMRGVVIEGIYADGVLLKRNGQVERLMHEKVDGIQTVSAIESAKREDARRQAEAERLAREAPAKTEVVARQARAKLSRQEIMSLFEWARFDPVTANDVAGVTVFPLKADVFSRSGLKSRDIVQSIGGVRINSDTDFQKLIADLENETETTIALLRGRDAVQLSISVTQ